MKRLTEIDKALLKIEPFVKSLLVSVNDREDAREIAQEVLIKAWLKMDLAKPTLRAWLRTTCRNTVADHWKCTKDRPLRVLDENPQVHEPSYEPELYSDLRSKIGKALFCLEEDTRQAVMLQNYGASCQEIAMITCTKPSTVKTRIYYGRKTLRRALQELEQYL
ncbi:MAG: RNA polymerase sigma factor [Cyanobacteria bacterium HKST-UBA02]|nr:RNA polymerase sigma factor [Cyanobacteria bacterium HKST-UBA02]